MNIMNIMKQVVVAVRQATRPNSDAHHHHTEMMAVVQHADAKANPVFDGVDKRYKAILWIVIALNGSMFLVELIAGRLAGSQALQADALDFLGDFLTYGISLAVIGMSLRTRSTAALVKGISLLGMDFGFSLQRSIKFCILKYRAQN